MQSTRSPDRNQATDYSFGPAEPIKTIVLKTIFLNTRLFWEL